MGCTRAGIEQVKDKIRTYVSAVFGAQVQTRTSLLGTVTAFGAHKHLLSNVEDFINCAVDLPSSIAQFQYFLLHAANKVHYVFGIGLDMPPSDMDLRVDKFSGYNSLIAIAAEKQTWVSIQKQMLTQCPHQLTQAING